MHNLIRIKRSPIHKDSVLSQATDLLLVWLVKNGYVLVLLGETIHEQLRELGGIEKITTALPDWPISDDTVMHLATAEGNC